MEDLTSDSKLNLHSLMLKKMKMVSFQEYSSGQLEFCQYIWYHVALRSSHSYSPSHGNFSWANFPSKVERCNDVYPYVKCQPMRQGQITTPPTVCATFFDECVGSLSNHVTLLTMLHWTLTCFNAGPLSWSNGIEIKSVFVIGHRDFCGGLNSR